MACAALSNQLVLLDSLDDVLDAGVGGADGEQVQEGGADGEQVPEGLVSLLLDAARAAAVLTQLTSMIGDGDGGEMLVVGWTGGARSC